jgi:hypothetical protein
VVTRFYLHNTTNSTTGLPTTKQSSTTTVANAQATTVNKNMTTTIGTSQATISNAQGAGYSYICRWISDIIAQTSLAANTWTFSFGYSDFWGSNNSGIVVCIYVWRPSTTTKIGNVCDATVAQAFTTGETGYKLTVTGSAVSSITTNDVLCVEFLTNSSFSGQTASFYYDGTTAVTTNNTSASSVAAYIETPETISLGSGGGGTIDATVTGKVNTNKIIVKG